MNKSQVYKNSVLIPLAVLLLMAVGLQAQEPIGDQAPEVKVIATATKDAIMLRWGVTTPTTWNYANTYGYTIKRSTITRDGVILAVPEETLLVSDPLRPKPMLEWEQFTEQSINAAVAAQAIYGDDFEVDMEDGGNAMVRIMNQASALEQRFGFALFAADQDFEVAKFSGLGYVDTTVVLGEQYLYTIATAIPTDRLVVASGGVYIGLMDYQPLPKPLDVAGVFNDKSVLLSWNYTLLKKYYNNYIIERSKDHGATFQRLDGIPVANMSEREKAPSDRMFYLDSLPQNGKEYQYRIKGISAFGQVGPSSDSVKGMGTTPLTHNPAILEARLSEDERTTTIIWEFPEAGLKSLSHFELHRSNTAKGQYQLLIPNIGASKRTVLVDDLQGINYFRLTAVGHQGTKRMSFPKMVQLSDATPPEIPTGLTGRIDTTGVVHLQWNKSSAPDFLGYRVYRANLENEEFTQRTFAPIPAPVFKDTVAIKNLNPITYYKVQAFDKRYNPSGFSEVLALQKPDLVPPTSPVFESFETTATSVSLQWITSSSQDAVKTLVYRKEKGAQTPWALAAAIPLSDTSFEDTDITAGTSYLYTLVTIDAAGLESKPIVPLSVQVPASKTPAISRLTAVVNTEERNIHIQWKYPQKDVVQYSLFKAVAEKKLSVYKVFDASQQGFTDTQLQVNTAYTYALQALLSNGSKSPIKTITVEY